MKKWKVLHDNYLQSQKYIWKEFSYPIFIGVRPFYNPESQIDTDYDSIEGTIEES